jgi:hypothetical protein
MKHPWDASQPAARTVTTLKTTMKAQQFFGKLKLSLQHTGG